MIKSCLFPPITIQSQGVHVVMASGLKQSQFSLWVHWTGDRFPVFYL